VINTYSNSWTGYNAIEYSCQNGGEISSMDHVEENGAKFNPTLARQFLYFMS
jgi:hypothetical protein